jgi:hypothetical protein
MHAHHQRLFIVAAIENTDPAALGQTFDATPEIIVIKIFVGRCLETSTPIARASLACGLSSDVKSSVSSGSMSFKRKPSSVIRNGLASLRAILIRSFISFLFTVSTLLVCYYCPLPIRYRGIRHEEIKGMSFSHF